jgi:DNA-binding beta-propeller fold protein YncE
MKTLLALALAGSSGLFAGTLFFGAYPNSVLVFDEGQEKVVDRIMLQTGLPTGLRLSADRKKIYVMTNDRSGIEIIDVATRKVINSLTLNSGNRKYRFNGGIADPQDKFFYTITTELVKEIDRFEIGRPKYTVIDLTEKKIVKTVELTREDEAASGGGGGRPGAFAISPDGKFLYQFRDSVSIRDTTTFQEVDKIELAKPEYPGMENIGFAAQLDSLAEPGYYTSMFNSSDPVLHGRVFGFARLNLTTRKADFTPIGPAPPAMSGLQVTPDKTRGYVVTTTNTHGNKRCEVWSFDLASNRITQTQEINCRSRFSFGMSSDGKKLYIYGAGFEFDVYDAATLKFVKTWDTNNDMTGGGLIAIP